MQLKDNIVLCFLVIQFVSKCTNLCYIGEALKQFCTQWPKGLESEEKQNKHFPVTVISSDYCHSGPTIRNPLGRIVTLKVYYKYCVHYI